MPEINVGEIFGFSKLSGAGGSVGTIALVIVIAIVLVILIAVSVLLVMRKRTYIYSIHIWKTIGNTPTRVGVYRAKMIPIGRAGDQLLYVGKLKKYLPPPTIQSASNEYWFYIREDGEFINFGMEDLDAVSKKAGVKFIHQDMRMQRLATDRLLEQRLMQKSFWEKWGDMIGMAILYIVIAVALTIFLFQYGKIVTQTGALLETAHRYMLESQGKGESGQLVPITLLLGIPINWIRRKLC